MAESVGEISDELHPRLSEKIDSLADDVTNCYRSTL